MRTIIMFKTGGNRNIYAKTIRNVLEYVLIWAILFKWVTQFNPNAETLRHKRGRGPLQT